MKKQLVFEGRKVRLSLAEVTLPNGRVVKRELVEHNGAVVILPLFENGNVMLEDHYRFAIDANLIEAPAGTLEPGEDPALCARRELAEETGLDAHRLDPLATFYTSPGILTEAMHAFLARDLTRGETRLEPDEILEPVEIPLDEAVKWVISGKIADAKTISILFLAKAFLDKQKACAE